MPVLLRFSIGLLVAVLSWAILPRPGHHRSLAAGVFELNIAFIIVLGLFLLGSFILTKVHKRKNQ